MQQLEKNFCNSNTCSFKLFCSSKLTVRLSSFSKKKKINWVSLESRTWKLEIARWAGELTCPVRFKYVKLPFQKAEKFRVLRIDLKFLVESAFSRGEASSFFFFLRRHSCLWSSTKETVLEDYNLHNILGPGNLRIAKTEHLSREKSWKRLNKWNQWING